MGSLSGAPSLPRAEPREVRELRAALALNEVERLGPARSRVLVDSLGSPSRVLEAFRSEGPAAERALAALERAGREPLSPAVRERLRRARIAPLSRLRDLRRRGIGLVRYGGRGYPERLTHLYDPPMVLWLQGPGRLPAGPAATVVGTRRATPYGKRMARDLGAGMAARGWCVVSGMARGIDGAAHRGALDAGGETVGVLGSGLEHEYPAANRDLYARMREAGLLVAEFPPAKPPARDHFPRRNRILAALAHVVVVVQAGKASGALITVRHASDLGRDVGAVPGPVGPEASEGVHELLRDGAMVVTCPADVVAAVGDGLSETPAEADPEPPAEADPEPPVEADPEPPAEADPERDEREGDLGADPLTRIRRRLEDGSAGADELALASGLPTGEALALLSRLELLRVVRPLPGGRYELR